MNVELLLHFGLNRPQLLQSLHHCPDLVGLGGVGWFKMEEMMENGGRILAEVGVGFGRE